MTKALEPMEKLTPVVKAILASFNFQGLGCTDASLPLRLMLRGLLDGLALSGELPVCEMRVLGSGLFGSRRVILDFADGTKGEFHIKCPNSDLPVEVHSLMERRSEDVATVHGGLRLVPQATAEMVPVERAP